MSTPSTTTSGRCANCGAELIGEYCHTCGQHAIDDADLAVRPLLREFGREVAQLDFKTVHSLRGLLSPGFLTREFLDGHRRRYLNPLKLYFVAAGIFFFAASLVGFTLEEMIADSDMLRDTIAARAQERSMDMALFTERFDLRIQTVYTASLSVSIVTMAALLKGLFRRWSLGAHVVFALHYVSFLYLGALAVAAVEKLLDLRGSAASIVLIYAILAPYQFIALRKVYGQSRLQTVWKVVVICAVTFVVDNLVNVGALLLTLRLV